MRKRLLGTFRMGHLTGGLYSGSAGSVGGGEKVSEPALYTDDTQMYYSDDTPMEYLAI